MSPIEKAVPHLTAALSRSDDDWTLEAVIAEVEAGRAHLWPGERSAGVTSGGRDLRIWLAGGDLRELLRMQESVEAWARAMGFASLSIVGRPGWDRIMKARGYRPALIKEL